MERYGVTADAFAKIGEKNHRHSVNNPYSQFQDQYSLEDIQNAPMVYDPLTKLQCCPTSDGGAAAVIASERFVREHGLEDQAVEIVGQAMTTDFENTFDGSDMSIAGFHMTQAAARSVYEQSGLGPEDVQVDRAARLLQRQRADHLRGPRALRRGQGRRPHPRRRRHLRRHSGSSTRPAASSRRATPSAPPGLAQCSELTWQLRGTADKRQVDDVTAALQHNLGLGGAAVVTMYRKAEL